MPLNTSSGNMYSWVTHTWNAIKGACPHDCSYCYMKRWGNLKPVRFDESEMETDLGKCNFIFVGSSCDMFAWDIPGRWIHDTLEHCRTAKDNKYLFQSKNPSRFFGFEFPAQSVFCTTIETNRNYPCIMRNAPSTLHRACAMSQLKYDIRYVTIEPIMDFDLDELVELVRLCKPEQVNIGADSGNNHLPEPSKDKILALVDELQKFTTIAQKRNLGRLLQ